MSIGERILKLRKQKGWKQKDLAKKAKVHPAHVSRWERGHMQPGSSTLARLAEVFEVSVDELVSSQEEEPSTVNDPQLLKTFQQAQQLPDEDKLVVMRMVDALITKKRMEQVLGKAL